MKTNSSPLPEGAKHINKEFSDSVNQEERHRLIQKEAYLISISRGFDKKDELND